MLKNQAEKFSTWQKTDYLHYPDLCHSEQCSDHYQQYRDSENDINFEYSETENSTVMTLTYGGDKFDPFTQGDEISAKIVQTLSAAADYAYDTENRVTVRFRG